MTRGVKARRRRRGPELDEDELLAEEGLKDDRLEARLAYALRRRAGLRRGDGGRVLRREHPMKAPEFRKACVAVMGRVFSKEETDRFFDEALAFSEDRSAFKCRPRKRRTRACSSGTSWRRIRGGMLLCLPKDDFVAYFSKFVTTVDPRDSRSSRGGGAFPGAGGRCRRAGSARSRHGGFG